MKAQKLIDTYAQTNATNYALYKENIIMQALNYKFDNDWSIIDIVGRCKWDFNPVEQSEYFLLDYDILITFIAPKYTITDDKLTIKFSHTKHYE